MTDEFTVEAVDIGLLKKLRIGHDNCGTVGQTPLPLAKLWEKNEFICDQVSFMFTFQGEDLQAGSLTGWKSMPRLSDRNYAFRAVAGWIKGRMMVPSSGTFSPIRFRRSFTPPVCMQEST